MKLLIPHRLYALFFLPTQLDYKVVRWMLVDISGSHLEHRRGFH